jgi:hypothetical protein
VLAREHDARAGRAQSDWRLDSKKVVVLIFIRLPWVKEQILERFYTTGVDLPHTPCGM